MERKPAPFLITILAALFMASSQLYAASRPQVSAQKGPLKLTLTPYSNRVPRDGPLWFCLSATNTDKKAFYINDPIFFRHFLRALTCPDGKIVIEKDFFGSPALLAAGDAESLVPPKSGNQ